MSVERAPLSKPLSARKVLSWIARGKSVARAMLNVQLERYSGLDGTILDLGGGGKPSYLEVLKPSGTFLNMDRIVEACPTVVGDLEGKLPFADQIADTVLLFNTLEHVYDYQHVANEIYRVLKPGAHALIYVPFMVGFHTHRAESFSIDDFFRYTSSALHRVFAVAGFADIRIVPMGGLFWVIGDLLSVAVRFGFLRIPLVFICCVLEYLTSRWRRFDSRARYPIAYFVELRR